MAFLSNFLPVQIRLVDKLSLSWASVRSL